MNPLHQVLGLSVWLLAGCAGLASRPSLLQVAVIPDTISPGSIITVRVQAPPGTHDVYGWLDVLGSPRVALHGQDQGQTWTFTTQIPLSAVWEPGRYRVVVKGIAAEGAELRGETWINAP